MFFLALRHLASKPRQTLLTLLGILLGSTAYVAFSGMMLGFQKFLVDQLIENDGHVKVLAREEFVTPEKIREIFFNHDNREVVDWIAPPSGRRDNNYILYPQGWFRRLGEDFRVAGYAPALSSQVIFSRSKAKLAGRLVGIDPLKQSLVTNIEKNIVSGALQDLSRGGERVLVGTGLLKRLGARVSETILVSNGSERPTPFKIVGTFQIGIKAIDDSTAYASLREVQKATRAGGQISEIVVKLSNVDLAESVAAAWSEISSDQVLSWSQVNEGFLSVFKTQDIVRNTITVVILIVAAFGTYNILTMSVNQKRRDIAILRSMGYTPIDIVKLFALQGTLLGVVGGILGLIAGYLLCQYIETIPISNQRMMGGNHMIIDYDSAIYVKGFLLAALSSSIASLLPARAAGRLQPIEIIRSEGT